MAEGGYGDGNYGQSIYGAPFPDTNQVMDASMWTLDTFGQYLVGCMSDDGNVYQWELDTGTPAALVAGAPSGAALFTTAEGMLMVLARGQQSAPCAMERPAGQHWFDGQRIQPGRRFPVGAPMAG